MDEIRDCRQHLVCRVNVRTGVVEHSYKRCFTQTVLPIGGQYVVELEGTRTVVTRVNETALSVESHQLVA